MNLKDSFKYKYLAKVYCSLHSSRLFRPAVLLYRDIANKLADRKRRAFYAALLKHNDLCFDIGANMGNRAAVFLEIGCRVVAVEPHAGCIEHMQRKFARSKHITLVHKAVDASIGEKELFMCPVDFNSSMSPAWIHALQQSGRCQSFTWNKRVKVRTTTLDALIKHYGVPAFCKIDVEGYELNVIKGLSQPIPLISFEFTQECIADARRCINHLSRIGKPFFNYSYGETMQLELKSWVPASDMLSLLSHIKERTSGDIYVKFEER